MGASGMLKLFIIVFRIVEAFAPEANLFLDLLSVDKFTFAVLKMEKTR